MVDCIRQLVPPKSPRKPWFNYDFCATRSQTGPISCSLGSSPADSGTIVNTTCKSLLFYIVHVYSQWCSKGYPFGFVMTSWWHYINLQHESPISPLRALLWRCVATKVMKSPVKSRQGRIDPMTSNALEACPKMIRWSHSQNIKYILFQWRSFREALKLSSAAKFQWKQAMSQTGTNSAPGGSNAGGMIVS